MKNNPLIIVGKKIKFLVSKQKKWSLMCCLFNGLIIKDQEHLITQIKAQRKFGAFYSGPR